MNLAQVTKLTEEEARDYLEKLRWPDGPYCPRCGCMDVTRLAGKSTRPGVYKCKAKGCRKPFTVTVGTIFERLARQAAGMGDCGPLDLVEQKGNLGPSNPPRVRRDLQDRLVHVPPASARDGDWIV